jgi:Ca2+-binding EF-hand superfamily protein
MERTSTIFESLDINGDGELNEEEFVEGCLNNKKLANLLEFQKR